MYKIILVLISLAFVGNASSTESEIVKRLTKHKAKELVSKMSCHDGLKPTVLVYERHKLYDYTMGDDKIIFKEGELKSCANGEQRYGIFCVELFCTAPSYTCKSNKEPSCVKSTEE
jgi:hypothetical protein